MTTHSLGRLLLLTMVAGSSAGLTAHGQNVQPNAQMLTTQPAGQQAAQTAPATDGPRLTFDRLSHEFGRITDEKTVEALFTFTNTGKSTLILQQPAASCGCTVPALDKLQYAPGESGTIKVTFNPAGRHGDQAQRVTVNSNDPSQPSITLNIHAFVRQTVWFEPPLVSFGQVLPGQTAVQQFRVHGPTDRDFRVTYVSTTRGRVFTTRVLETKPVEIDGEKFNQSLVEVTFNGNAPRGAVTAMGIARTTLESHPLADFQVLAEVVGDLQVQPQRVNAGVLEGGQPFSRTFRIASRTGAAFNITKIDQQTNLSTPLAITFRPAEEGKTSEYVVEIKGVAPGQAVPIQGSIIVETSSATDPRIEVFLSGAVRPTGQGTAERVDRFDGPGNLRPPMAPPSPPPQPTTPPTGPR